MIDVKGNLQISVVFILLAFGSCTNQNETVRELDLLNEKVKVSASIGTSYFVANNGKDSNNGSSKVSPWKTIDKVNNSNFNAGDRIYFKKGDIWSETLIPSSSGTIENRIIYDCYGSGSIPVITGGVNKSGITWTNTRSYLTFRNIQLEDCGKPNGKNQGGVNIFNSGEPSIGIVIEGMIIKNSRTWNIYISGVDDLIIRNNSISNAQIEHGIYLDGSQGLHNVTVEGNRIFDNNQMGIQLNSNNIERVADAVVRYNEISNCDLGGINNIGADGLLCHNNLIYGEMTSIYNGCDQFDTNCDNGARNGKYYNNTLVTYGTQWATCFANAGGDGDGYPSYKAFKNNICLQSSIIGPIFADIGNSTNIVNDYNLYYSTNASLIFRWKNVDYNSFSLYTGYTGQDPNGLYDNPILDSDFSLISGSPAIDTGINLNEVNRDINNILIPQRQGPDIGAFEF